MSTSISPLAHVGNQVLCSLPIVIYCGAMLTQNRTRPVFKIASEIVNAKFARVGIISSKEIIGALLGAIVEDERLVKVCLCSEAGAYTLD
jgi:hypothetical protein